MYYCKNCMKMLKSGKKKKQVSGTDGLLSQKDLAAKLGCSYKTINYWKSIGLPVHKVGLNLNFYNLEEVMEWVADRRDKREEFFQKLREEKQRLKEEVKYNA